MLLICFHFFAVINNAVVIFVYKYFFMWMYVLISVKYIPGNEIAESYDVEPFENQPDFFKV